MTLSRRHFLQASAAGVLTLAARNMVSGQTASVSESICPKSAPPARNIFAMRIQELTSHKEDFALTLYCLQGLANRKQPRLYISQDAYDEKWLDWMRERGDVESVQWLEIGEVFERFLPEAHSMYITDPNIPATVNVATMLAGLDSALVVTPDIADQFPLPAGAYPDSSKVGYDLRRMHWKKDVDAYRWFFANHGSRLSRRAVSMLDPATYALRDYLVEFQIPVVWISAPEDAGKNPQASFEEEQQFTRELFLQWPANIPCFGWPGNGEGQEAGIGEWDGVRLASECAKFEVCSGYDGYSPTVSNLSVHSGTKAQFHQKTTPSPKLQRDKVYFAFVRSDGDGMNFLRHYYRKLFDDPNHGSVPLGWQIGPTAADIMPDILSYYYSHARPGDCFVNALSGIGYIHEDSYADAYPESQRPEIFRRFISLSEQYRARIDATTMSTFEEMPPERLDLITSIPGIKGIFANYGRTHVTTMDNLLTTTAQGKPVFRAVNSLQPERTFTIPGRRDAEATLIRQVHAGTPQTRPFFLHVFLANWLITMDMAKNIAAGLGPEYVAVRPDQLVDLYEQSRRA